MKQKWLIGIIVFLAVVLIGIILKTKILKEGNAAISVSATPRAKVFIDGVQVGTTPYLSDKFKPGEHTVKLIPETTTDSLLPWEGEVTLNSNILTVINRNLSSTAQTSSGEVIWLEKIPSKDRSSITVISFPDQAVVKLDGEPKGFSPVTIEELNPGGYQIIVASPGYEERTVSVKTIAGYKLIVNIQLAKKIEGVEEATGSGEKAGPTPTPKVTPRAAATPPEKPYVRIKETPTGWLRVRSGPSTSAAEVDRVNPEEMFPYLGEEKNGWYKIEYEKGKEGWVSGVYVELIE